MSEVETEAVEWTEEDIRFVLGDRFQNIDDMLRQLARAAMSSAAKMVRELHTQLGYPTGFDPYVYGLVYAKAAVDQTLKSEAEIGKLEGEIELRDQQLELLGLQLQREKLLREGGHEQ